MTLVPPSDIHEILERAEIAAGRSAESMYELLRLLPLADFCKLHLTPPLKYPTISSLLPEMPDVQAQKQWVGDSGTSLMTRSANLVRLLEVISFKATGSGLAGKRILDYGCGWGRLLRLMNYYSPVSQVIGADPMQSSLDHCAQSSIPNPTHLIPTRPTDLSDIGAGVDFAFSFSVFTHTPADVISLVLNALRPQMAADSLFVPTIRSLEWLSVRKDTWPPEVLRSLEASYNETGYAFQTFDGASALAAQDYGDTMMTIDYFSRLAHEAGWTAVLVDRDYSEPFQIAIALRPS